VGETFGRAAAFLQLAADDSLSRSLGHLLQVSRGRPG